MLNNAVENKEHQKEGTPFEGFHHTEPTDIQIRLLNKYRFTDEFRREYGRILAERNRDKKLVLAAIRDIKRAKKTDEVSFDSHRELIEDMLYTNIVMGFKMHEYLAYGLDKLSLVERMEFLPERARMHYYAKLNAKGGNKLLYNKYMTYRHIEYAFKRKMIEIEDTEQKEAFFALCDENESLVVKPRGGSLGRGVKLVHVSDYADPDAMFHSLMKEYGVGKDSAILVEEPIIQHPDLAVIHPESVNSLRVFTYNNGESVSVIFAGLKAGMGRGFVDNGVQGGMLARVDENTGVIVSDARTPYCDVYPTHPDTGFVFKGHKIAQWDEVTESVKTWARDFPKTRVIAWDVAVSAEKGVQAVEGNCWGMVNVLQIPAQAGLYRDFLKKVEWEKWR